MPQTGQTGVEIDNINGTATLGFVIYGGPIDIGWYYTPITSYALSGIFTNFEPVPNGSREHTITMQVQSERPINGRTVLVQGAFEVNSATGGVVGANSYPIQPRPAHGPRTGQRDRCPVTKVMWPASSGRGEPERRIRN